MSGYDAWRTTPPPGGDCTRCDEPLPLDEVGPWCEACREALGLDDDGDASDLGDEDRAVAS